MSVEGWEAALWLRAVGSHLTGHRRDCGYEGSFSQDEARLLHSGPADAGISATANRVRALRRFPAVHDRRHLFRGASLCSAPQIQSGRRTHHPTPHPRPQPARHCLDPHLPAFLFRDQASGCVLRLEARLLSVHKCQTCLLLQPAVGHARVGARARPPPAGLRTGPGHPGKRESLARKPRAPQSLWGQVRGRHPFQECGGPRPASVKRLPGPARRIPGPA